jgi:hypothetical protein
MVKKKSTKYKQRSTKHTHKTRDGVTRTPLKTGGKPMCFGRENSFRYTKYENIMIKTDVN